jgi:maleamate amidohydrolase
MKLQGNSMQNNEELQKDQAFFEARGFGMAIGYGKRPALLVIDMIQAFTRYQDPAMVLAANLEREMQNIKRILDVTRSKDIPTFFTSVAYTDQGIKDAGIWALKQKGLVTLRAGTPEVEVDPALRMVDGEMLIVKKYASAFFGTDLLSRLVAHQVDTLIITGCTTSGCVRASAVDGISNGFRPAVVGDAVGDRSARAHEQGLFDLQAKYADVVSTDDVIEYLQTVST